MGRTGCPETSVQNYHSRLRNIPEERRSYQLYGGSLKSPIANGTSQRTLSITSEWNNIAKINVFHVHALYHTKTLITNKCTKRVLSSIVTHSYMFRPCWVIFRENFCYRYTKVALYSWERMCCWLCTALFLEAWTPRGPGLQARTTESSRLQYTVHSQIRLIYYRDIFNSKMANYKTSILT
jgi:hypothetical protein